MALHYDEKGKFFTDFVSKYPVPVVIQTRVQRIRGTVYVREEQRLSDELNQTDNFLPVTDATIYTDNGEVLDQAHFLAVSRQQIIWIHPEEEPADEQEQDQDQYQDQGDE